MPRNRSQRPTPPVFNDTEDETLSRIHRFVDLQASSWIVHRRFVPETLLDLKNILRWMCSDRRGAFPFVLSASHQLKKGNVEDGPPKTAQQNGSGTPGSC